MDFSAEAVDGSDILSARLDLNAFMLRPLLRQMSMTSLAPLRPVEKHPVPGAWNYRFGQLPAYLFLPLLIVVVALNATGKLGPDVMSMLGALAVGGYFCAWLGGVVPILSRVGGPALVAAFLPSYLVYRGLLPPAFVNSVTQFTKNSQFIYLYVTVIVTGSILSLDRRVLLRGAARVFVPLIAGSLLASALVPLIGRALGMPYSYTLTMIVTPITGGGVGEGAIPLSSGYAELHHGDPAAYLAQILPIVLMANMFAVMTAGLLKLLGQWRPEWSGNGRLQPGTGKEDGVAASHETSSTKYLLDGLMFGVLLYLTGMALQGFTKLPAPVLMLVLAVMLRVLNWVPARVCEAAHAAGRLAAAGMTHPLLFAVAVALTPWSAVCRAFHWDNVVLVLATVCILTLTGLLAARLVGLNPIECALVNACHTGSGGTGDVAILSAADRLGLMPFAQIATRIGGALTVSITLLLMRLALRGSL